MERELQDDASNAKVMTDEQVEVLRKQIAIYGTLCEQLVYLHTSLSLSTGMNQMSGGYFDPTMATSGGRRLSSTRHRWTPTSGQLEKLESIYEVGNGTPNPKRIKEIATELSEHGRITEKNVYNWFQNRRARSKRKQPPASTEASHTDDPAEERRSTGDSGVFESYDHILFPSRDCGIEHLMGR